MYMYLHEECLAIIHAEVAFIGAVLFIHKSWCKFRLKKSLSIVVLLLGNSLLHNGLVNSIEHACVLITVIPTDYTCITHLQTELLCCMRASPVSTISKD